MNNNHCASSKTYYEFIERSETGRKKEISKYLVKERL
jgi:hypothetical protein